MSDLELTGPPISALDERQARAGTMKFGEVRMLKSHHNGVSDGPPIDVVGLREEIKMTSRTIARLSKGGHETADASRHLNALRTRLSALMCIRKHPA